MKRANAVGREVVGSYSWYVLQLACKIHRLELEELICSTYKNMGWFYVWILL